MLKIVVFDGGYGGELFADYLEEALPVVEIVRVIDWRNANSLITDARSARATAEAALKPYLGQADLIIFANHLLSLTSLRYFRRHYPAQLFLGLSLELPSRPSRDILILTTRAVSRTLSYHHFCRRIKTHTKTLTLDSWPAKIDDGELDSAEIAHTLQTAAIPRHSTRDIVLGCSQFSDIKKELYDYFHRNIRIHDSFEDTLHEICHLLKIRGGTGRKKFK